MSLPWHSYLLPAGITRLSKTGCDVNEEKPKQTEKQIRLITLEQNVVQREVIFHVKHSGFVPFSIQFNFGVNVLFCIFIFLPAICYQTKNT